MALPSSACPHGALCLVLPKHTQGSNNGGVFVYAVGKRAAERPFRGLGAAAVL